MLSPFLFIGVGGSGGKTLWTLRDELKIRLAEFGYEGDLPAAWQFIHIDVPTIPDGLNPALGEPLPAGSYVGLVSKGIVYKTIDTALMQGADDNTPLLRSLVGWRPDPKWVSVPVQKGAGQFRTLGRAITLTNLGKVRAAIESSVELLQGASILSELTDISRAVGALDDTHLPDPVAIVVSSMAGGSGAGAVLDVCDVLRSTGLTWADRSFGLLYAPDVFGGLPPAAKKGVQPNALATLCELMAGFWNNQAPGAPGFEEEFAPFEHAKITVGTFDRRGPRYPLIVGSSNGDITFSQQDEVYRAAGKALAAWTVSPALQDHLGPFFETNFQSSVQGVADHLPLRVSGTELPFSAIGFGRVALGRDRFARYSVERLARLGVDRLLHRHEEGREAGREFDSQAAIEELVVTRVQNFINESGLDERGEERNLVLNALRPGDRADRMTQFVDEICSEISVGLHKGAPARRWTELAVSRLQMVAQSFADDERAKRLENARDWAYSLSTRLTTLMARTIARDGFAVTLALVDRLDADIQYALGELPSERDDLLRHAQRMEEYVAQEIGRAGDGKIVPASTYIRAGVERGVACMEWRAEADLRELAGKLLDDVKANLLQPLRRSVKTAMDRLAIDEQHQPGTQNSMIATWPEGDVVPARFEPSDNERLLLGTTKFLSEFERKIIDSTRAADPGGAISQAVSEVLLGEVSAEDASQQMISVRQQWHPSHPDVVRELGGAGTKAVFELATKPDDLLTRGRAWVSRPETAFGSFINESLQSYLGPEVDPVELDRRLSTFRSEFMSAISASQPLVDISPQLLAKTHEIDKATFRMFFTEIPFPVGAQSRKVAEEVLLARGLLTPEVETSFGEGATDRVDVFSVLDSPFEPVVFNSIFRPIAKEWSALKNSRSGRDDFWRWRRARPLPWFLPVGPDVRTSMVRGWFVGRLLGQIETSLDEGKVAIYCPERKSMLGFPSPLIGPEVAHERDLLPAVLESLPLAMLDFTAQADGEAAVVPYAQLRLLGQTAQQRDEESFSPPCLPLTQWISTGSIQDSKKKLQPGAPLPNPTDAGTPTDDPAARLGLVSDYFRTRLTQYEGLFEQPLEKLTFFETPRVVELRTDIMSALNHIITGLRTYADEEGSW